ncbi:Holliday junction recognition protein [Xenopus laevis]|nr:Holliday junction recognition protein [Xenopus laevis]ADZ54038.1 HJURP [Xenopus laevis]
MDPGRGYKSRRHGEQQSYSEVWDDCFESDPTKDFFGCLDKNEKIFQARMREILEKYNKPFEDDVLVDIESLAYITPNKSLFQDSNLKASSTQRKHPGRKEQKCEAAISVCSETFLCDEGDIYHADSTNNSQLEKESEDAVCNETFIISDENSSECHLEDPSDSQLVEFKGSSPLKHLSEMRHGKTYAANVDIILQANETSIPRAFTVQCTEENSFSFKVSPMKFRRQTCDHGNTADISQEYLGTRTAHCNASPIKVSISSHLKSFFGRHHRDGSTVVDHHSLKQKEPDEYNFGDDEDSDSSDPLDVSLADYYPSMIVCLSRLMEIPCKQQAAANIIKHYRRRIWCANKNRPDIKKAKKQICISDNAKLFPSLKPKSKKTSITFLTETNKPIPCQHRDFEESGIIEHKERRVHDGHFHAMSSQKATFPVSEQMTNTILLSKEKYLPDKPLKREFENASLSPKYVLPKFVPMDNKLIRKSTSNQYSVALLNQRQLKYDGFVPKIQVSPNKLLTKVPQRSVPVLARRHSFSTFPDKNRSMYDGAFETLYRKLLSEGSHQRSLPPNTQYPLSDTVNALINSPILNKGKRPASEDLPFSKFKRHRSATETFVLDNSNPKMYALPSQMRIVGSDLWQGSSQRWNPKEHHGQPILSLSRSPGSLSTCLYRKSPKYLETFSLPSSPVQRTSLRKLNYN